MNAPFRPLAIALATFLFASTPSPGADVTEVPPFDRFLVIPLRVHVLTSKDLELADGKITDAEVVRAVSRINAIWDKAGISFGLEAIFREPASQVERFKANVEANDGQGFDNELFTYLMPASSRTFEGLHLYIFRDLPFNSIYYAAVDAAVVKEQPELNQVAGGSDHPLSRVSSRSLGLALGLKARPDQFGALSSGTNGIGLDADEIRRARKVARTLPGALDVAAAAKAAEIASKQGNLPRARQLLGWLAEIPGPGAAEAREKLRKLPPG